MTKKTALSLLALDAAWGTFHNADRFHRDVQRRHEADQHNLVLRHELNVAADRRQKAWDALNEMRLEFV